MSKTVSFARRHGLLRLANCVLCRAALRVLQSVFRFDSWHARAPLACRPYKRSAAALAAGVKPVLAVEIGCGLGAIISGVDAPRKVGLDVSPQTVAAASFVNGRRARFDVASLYEPEAVAGAVGQGPIDVLILVNWVNALSMSRIVEALDGLRSRIDVRHLVIDETPPESGLHTHDVDALGALGEVIDSWRDDERGLHLVRLAPAPLSRSAAST